MKNMKNGRRGRVWALVVGLAACMLFSVSAQAGTKDGLCKICNKKVNEYGIYCDDHTCRWSGCHKGVPVSHWGYCTRHRCQRKGCYEPVKDGSSVQACERHYEYYKAKLAETSSSSKTSGTKSTYSSSGKSSTQKSSSAKKCKYSGCKNWGVSYKRGYCNKHYKQLYETRDDYYDEDPESYYQDNKSQYQSRSEAYDDWEDEYEED